VHDTLLSALVVALTLHVLLVDCFAAGFSLDGRKVPPNETNFAGERQVSPKFAIVVQLNHDTSPTRDLELTIVDDVFQSLLADHQRAPLLPNDFLTVVFITEAKLRRFFEGQKRWIFRPFEERRRPHPEVYLSPTAVFISEGTLADERRLRSALYEGLGYLFNREFYAAMQGLIERGIPVPYPHE